MSEVLFILERQGKSGGGGYLDGAVVNFDTLASKELLQKLWGIDTRQFIGYGRGYIVRVAIVGKRLFTLKELSLRQFEELFEDRVDKMDWLLEYYPKAGNIRLKYPLFKKEIYQVYGKPLQG